MNPQFPDLFVLDQIWIPPISIFINYPSRQSLHSINQLSRSILSEPNLTTIYFILIRSISNPLFLIPLFQFLHLKFIHYLCLFFLWHLCSLSPNLSLSNNLTISLDILPQPSHHLQLHFNHTCLILLIIL